MNFTSYEKFTENGPRKKHENLRRSPGRQMVKVWENDPVNSEMNSTRVKILESVQKIVISLLYKLHPTEKSSKSQSSHWWESWEWILILYFYFHQST